MKLFKNIFFVTAIALSLASSAFAVTKGQCSASSLRARNNSVTNYRNRCDKAQANVAKYQGIVAGFEQQLPSATDPKTKKAVLRNINLNRARLAAAQRSTNISCARHGVLLGQFNTRKSECLAAFPNTVTPTPGPTLNPTPTPRPTGGPGGTPTPTPTPGPTATATPTPTPVPTLFYVCGPGSGSVDGSNSQEGVCARFDYYREGSECFRVYEYYCLTQAICQNRINYVNSYPEAKVLWSGLNSQNLYQVNAVVRVGPCPF